LLPKLRSKFSKSQAYGMDKIKFAIASDMFNIVESVASLLLGFMPYLWDIANHVGTEKILYIKVESEIGISLIFLLLIIILKYVLFA